MIVEGEWIGVLWDEFGVKKALKILPGQIFFHEDFQKLLTL
jgi:hypothetical protein